MTQKKKLIEVALPLDAINKASAREKSISRGQLSRSHVWRARFSLELSVNGGTLLGRVPDIPYLPQKEPDFRLGRVDADLDKSYSRGEACS